ncbi:MAG: hypothetical protein JWQ35_1941 [Bacteriovoracaceae bacterium]|nr:hypothetical protein [Bacteriovoracaceae bacterium]
MQTPIYKSPNPIESLEKVLLEQLEHYEKYAEHLHQDRELMARLKIDQLEQSNKIKNTLLLKIQTMDRARQNLVKQIAKDYNISEANIRISDICRAVGGQSSSRLFQIRDRLNKTMETLRGIQNQTQLFAHTSLAWINGSISALKGLLTPSGTYNLRGKVDRPGMFAGRTVEKQA